MIRNILYSKKNKGLRFLLKVRAQRLNIFVNLMRTDGPYVGYKILNDKVLLLGDATAIQNIFQEKNDIYIRSKYIKNLKHLFAGGIFLSDGAFWKQQRHEAAPVFANGYFPEMVDHMVDSVNEMFVRWDQKIALNQYIDINAEVTRYSLDVALRYLFHTEGSEIVTGIQDNLGHLLREAETRIWALISLPQSLVMQFPIYKNALKILRHIVDDLIKARQKTGSYGNDLLSRAIKSYESGETSHKVLNDKIIAYLTSAHETTANVLAWAIYEISQRPEIEKKIIDEANLILGNSRPTYDEVKQMNYTRQVFDETLRLYPSVWTMSREAYCDNILPLDDGTFLSVKKGTTIMLCPYAVHRRDTYWPNPMSFNPDRFTPEAVQERPKMSYFPFAGGARLCLGFRFAQMEGIVALAMALQQYQISLIPGQRIEPNPNITLRPNGSILCDIKRRHPKNILKSDTSSPTPNQNSASCPFHSTEPKPFYKAA